jgi:hypothetical protein
MLIEIKTEDARVIIASSHLAFVLIIHYMYLAILAQKFQPEMPLRKF